MILAILQLAAVYALVFSLHHSKLYTMNKVMAAFLDTFSNYTLTFILICSCTLALLLLPEGLDWSGDYALYLNQAQSLFTGTEKGLLELNSANMARSIGPAGPDLYPWGYPLLLAGVQYFAGYELMAFKLMHLLFFYGALVVLYYLFGEGLGCGARLLLIGLFAFNPFMLAFCGNVRSDIPFLFFAMLSILLIQKTNPWQYSRKNLWLSLGTGLAIFIAYTVRTEGLMLLPVWLCWQVWKGLGHTHSRSWYSWLGPLCTLLAPLAVFSMGNMYLNTILPQGSGSHVEFLRQVNLELVLGNAKYYLKLPSKFFPFAKTSIGTLLHAGFFAMMLIGLIAHFKRYSLYWLYMGAVLPVFLIWPSQQGPRFIFTLVPFYFFFAFKGFELVQGWICSKFPVPVLEKLSLAGMAVAIVLAGHIFSTSYNLSHGQNHIANLPYAKTLDGPYSPDASEMLRFINAATQPDDLIVFRRPRVISWITGRPAIAESRMEKLRSLAGSYLVVDNTFGPEENWQLNLAQLSVNTRSLLLPVFRNNRFKVYRILASPVMEELIIPVANFDD